ncbi:class I SAM-dependent methyltransferase [Halolamina sp. C58]|uniref:class I SAM-dependent methyltransferase n=1 Tax=Halolamina sp. C58 TaxID=3421640 RepID=UPI003EB989AF
MPTAGDSELDTPALALLWAARETGLLAALVDGAGDEREAADAAGVTERAARIVTDALIDLGFLRRVDGAVEPANRALGLLATRDLRSVGTVPAALDRFDAYAELPRTMESGVPPVDPDERVRHRLGAAAAVDDDTVEATVDAALAANPDAERALVVADGPGRHATALAGRGLDVTLLDGPAVIEAVKPLLASTPVTPRAGSLVDVAATFDLVLTVDGAWRQGVEENRFTVLAAADALSPGGAVVLVEPLRDRSGAAVEVAAAALATGTGEPYPESTVAEWFLDAGLAGVETSDVPGTPYQAAVGRRDGSAI